MQLKNIFFSLTLLALPLASGSPIDSTLEERAQPAFFLEILNKNGNPGFDARFLITQDDGMGPGFLAGTNQNFAPHDEGNKYLLRGGTLKYIGGGIPYGITHLVQGHEVQAMRHGGADVHLALNSANLLTYKGDASVWRICALGSANGLALALGDIEGKDCKAVELRATMKD